MKGDALNVYTDQQFSPGEKFILTDSKRQQYSFKPVALSLDQAVLEIPKALAPGAYTINDKARFNLIVLGLSSPNTNLKSGQTSSVTLTIGPRDPVELKLTRGL